MITQTLSDPKAELMPLLQESQWPLAAEALIRAAELPVPTRRSEQWKYTRVNKLFRQEYVRPMGQVEVELPPRLPFDTTRVVFVNGHFRPELSDDLKAHPGVVVDSIKHHLTHGPFKANYGTLASTEQRLFTAMNTAAPTDGLIILATRGARTRHPIHVLRITTPEQEGRALLIQPRDLLMLHDEAEVELIDEHIAIGQVKNSLVNSVRESILGAGAKLNVHLLQNEADGPTDIGQDCVKLAEKADFRADTTTLYGELVRNDIEVTLDGREAHCELNGIYLLDKDNHCDNHTLIYHNVSDCTCDELYKGVVGGNATAVFYGKIHVRQDAQNTRAYQSNANILNSENAKVYSKPALEIYADDVRCSHGCTVGRLDEQAIFYLRSRGVSEQEARRLMANAFVIEVLERLENEQWKEHLASLIDAKLQTI